MKDFTAIISTCKFGQLSITEANKMINEQLDTAMPNEEAVQNLIYYSQRMVNDTEGIFLGALGAQSRKDLQNAIDKIKATP